MGYTTLDIGIPSPIGAGVSVGVGNGVRVEVAPGTGVGVIVGVDLGATAGADVGVGVGTAVAEGTGIGTPGARVIVAVIDHDVPLATIVPVLPISELTPPSITVDPATVG